MKNNYKDAPTALNTEELLSDVSGLQIEDVTPKDLLKLGREILLALTILFIFGAISQLIWPSSSVFEAIQRLKHVA